MNHVGQEHPLRILMSRPKPRLSPRGARYGRLPLFRVLAAAFPAAACSLLSNTES
ncbi:hypothetical protein PO124_17270 [Bacillus licheniformis]|nr:hypothetical protein [Bacillus licheniformis]